MERTYRKITAWLLAATLASFFAVIAQAEEEKQTSEASTPDVSAMPPIYLLPKVGKPTGRVGGGRRGLGDGTPDIYALVPDHVGYTISAQPVLYWYLSETAKGDIKFELTLIDEASIEPLVDQRIASPKKSGIQSIDLSKYGVKLKPGEEYQWSIALVPDPEDRSKDVVSSGWIERIAEPKGIEDRLSKAGPSGAASVYGTEGLWYDTLAATHAQLIRNPDDPRHRQQLSTLLGQVGLPDSAAGQ
ncbi:MAG: DUF928 domain-containing protein [Acidobacteria bacterium]|nr:DUF928 domain-containing protein [Acidobacteriota bacterium]